MGEEALRWQRENNTTAKALIAEYDIGAAARSASVKGRELTPDELDGFRRDAHTTRIPRRVLVFDGIHYSFA